MNRILNTFDHKTHAAFLYRASGGGINQAVQAIEKAAPFETFQHQQGF